MRNEMIGAIVRRAIEHPEFRRRLIDNPQEALAAHGFVLEDSDMAEIDKIRGQLRGSHTDVEKRLVGIAERYGVHPQAG
jgi:hypothetical protein